jgi:hypothetical protein
VRQRQWQIKGEIEVKIKADRGTGTAECVDGTEQDGYWGATAAGCCTWYLPQHEGEGLANCGYRPLGPSSLEFAQGKVQGPALLRVESLAHLSRRGEKGEERREGRGEKGEKEEERREKEDF